MPRLSEEALPLGAGKSCWPDCWPCCQAIADLDICATALSRGLLCSVGTDTLRVMPTSPACPARHAVATAAEAAAEAGDAPQLPGHMDGAGPMLALNLRVATPRKYDAGLGVDTCRSCPGKAANGRQEPTPTGALCKLPALSLARKLGEVGALHCRSTGASPEPAAAAPPVAEFAALAAAVAIVAAGVVLLQLLDRKPSGATPSGDPGGAAAEELPRPLLVMSGRLCGAEACGGRPAARLGGEREDSRKPVATGWRIAGTSPTLRYTGTAHGEGGGETRGSCTMPAGDLIRQAAGPAASDSGPGAASAPALADTVDPACPCACPARDGKFLGGPGGAGAE